MDLSGIAWMLTSLTIMKDRENSWGSKWLFVLWALLLAGSIAAAKPASGQADIAHPYTRPIHAMSSLIIAADGDPLPTTRGNPR